MVVGSLSVVLTEQFFRFIATHIGGGIPIFLSIPGPAGYGCNTVFLNNALAQIVASKDYDRLAEELAKVIKTGMQAPKIKIELRQ